MSEEFGGDIYSISDEEGNEYSLEHLDTIELDGVYYLAFLPADMDEDDDDYGIVLLKMNEGEDFFSALTEEEEDRVYDIFMEKLFGDDEDPLNEE